MSNHSAYDLIVPKRGSALVKTDIQVQLPSGTYGRVAPRSGLALKNKIDVGGELDLFEYFVSGWTGSKLRWP